MQGEVYICLVYLVQLMFKLLILIIIHLNVQKGILKMRRVMRNLNLEKLHTY